MVALAGIKEISPQGRSSGGKRNGKSFGESGPLIGEEVAGN